MITGKMDREMLLWILFVGGIASRDEEKYGKMTADLLWDDGAAAFHSVPSSFSQFVWSPRLEDKAYDALMNNVRDRLENKAIHY
jgi:hypothetical protein